MGKALLVQPRVGPATTTPVLLLPRTKVLHSCFVLAGDLWSLGHVSACIAQVSGETWPGDHVFMTQSVVSSSHLAALAERSSWA